MRLVFSTALPRQKSSPPKTRQRGKMRWWRLLLFCPLFSRPEPDAYRRSLKVTLKTTSAPKNKALFSRDREWVHFSSADCVTRNMTVPSPCSSQHHPATSSLCFSGLKKSCPPYYIIRPSGGVLIAPTS